MFRLSSSYSPRLWPSHRPGESGVLFEDIVDLQVFSLAKFLAVSSDDHSIRIPALTCTPRMVAPQAGSSRLNTLVCVSAASPDAASCCVGRVFHCFYFLNPVVSGCCGLTVPAFTAFSSRVTTTQVSRSSVSFRSVNRVACVKLQAFCFRVNDLHTREIATVTTTRHTAVNHTAVPYACSVTSFASSRFHRFCFQFCVSRLSTNQTIAGSLSYDNTHIDTFPKFLDFVYFVARFSLKVNLFRSFSDLMSFADNRQTLC